MQDLPEIRNQLSHQLLFDAFKLQLEKDFIQSNFPADFTKTLEPDYDDILAKITLELKQSENKADANLMQLLYRVDISEAQLRRYLEGNKTENYYHVVAGLIIKRILQKVVIKHYYKKNE